MHPWILLALSLIYVLPSLCHAQLPIGQWSNRSSSLRVSLTGVAYGGGIYVVVGDYHEFLRSTNGDDWEVVTDDTLFGSRFTGVAFGEGRFVAVGDRSTIFTSTNGRDWDKVQPPTSFSKEVNDVVYGAGNFVAVGDHMIWHSENGLEWIDSSPIRSDDFHDVSFGGGRFVTIGRNNSVFVSTTGGRFWDSVVSEVTIRNTCAYFNNRFYGVGGVGSQNGESTVVTSADGRAWTEAGVGIPSFTSDLYVGGGKLYAVDPWGVSSTENGVAWTSESVRAPISFSSGVYGNGVSVVVGQSGAVFVKRDPLPPGQTTIPGPANGATSVAITTDLSWGRVSDAQQYKIYFGRSSSLGEADYLGATATNQYELAVLTHSTKYYWRADSLRDGLTTRGNVWSFTTVAPPRPPGRVGFPDPSDGATSVATSKNLAWRKVPDAQQYRVYFGATPSLGESNLLGSTEASQFDLPDLDHLTKYYWRIDSVKDELTTTGDVWSFTTERTIALPGKVEVVYPRHGESYLPATVQLRWNASEFADQYRVYLGRDGDLGDSQYVGSTQNTEIQLPTLTGSGVYYWRVDAENLAGVTAGDVVSFRAGPREPVLYSPQNDEVFERNVIPIEWEADITIDGYRVVVAEDPDLSDVVAEVAAFEGPLIVPGLEYGHRYYWYVEAQNQGLVNRSEVRSFRIQSEEFDSVRILGVRLHGREVRITLATKPGRQYMIVYSDILDDGRDGFVSLPPVFAFAPISTLVDRLDDDAIAQRFYWVIEIE